MIDKLNEKNQNSIFDDLLNNLDDENKNEELINYFKLTENEGWNYRSGKESLSILHILVKKNLFDLLKQIIDIAKQNTSEEIFNKFVNSKDIKGRTPFLYACFFSNIKAIKFLLNNGVEYNVKDNKGRNCLHLSAIRNKVTPIYYMIKKYNMNIYEKDNDGNTFFHWACSFCSQNVIYFFLDDKNFNINIPDNKGNIPLHYYLDSGNCDCLKRLILYGADPYMKNNEGKNSFDIANEKYSTKDKKKKKHVLSILRTKYYNNFQYWFFMFFHIIFIFLIILFQFPFIDKKYILVFFLIWTFFIWSFILYFISLDSGTFKKNTDNYLLSLIDENENDINLLKYCIKCQIKKELYTKHCFYCDKCIKDFDHHCYWLNKCIGKNNKFHFNILIVFLLINSYVYFIPFYFAQKNERIMNLETLLKIFFLSNLSILQKMKIFIFYLYLLFLISINIIILPLIKFCLEQKHKNNMLYKDRINKTEPLIEMSEIVNEETINLLDENNNNN